MKVNKGISKGGKERIKPLESEIDNLKIQLKRAEKRNQEFDNYLEDEQPFLIEFERLMAFLTSFVKWSQQSNKLLTKRDKAELKKRDPEIVKEIFGRIGLSEIAKEDREKNEALYNSLTRGNELTRIKTLLPHLQKALEFANSFKPAPQRKRKPTENEVAFWNAMNEHNIKPIGLDYVLDELEQRNYTFKRTAVHSYLRKKNLLKKRNSA